ncbi:tripartite tricarboxylate transporter permease [Georgenia sp. AZ-5]|uniref:tripartite tricarboxylate transporter permease n=1 Tax=Georgenia sp. AZ-5 TaxID=3367526 RepID=UPI0037544AE9
MQAIIDGLSMLTPELLAWMLAGIVICQVVVIIPGLSAQLLLALILPFLYTMDQSAAIGLLVGAAATSGTGNTITAVLFGVPGNAAGVATLFDGHPMARRGEASRAILAGLISSAIGGIIGAAILALLIPFAKPISVAVGPPELFALALVSLVFLAFLGEGSVMKGLIAGGLGLLLAFIGQESSGGVLRYTFGQLALWDGISIATFAIGIFGIAEMLELIARGGAIASGEHAVYRRHRITDSFRDIAHSWRTVLQSSVVGTVIGILPGIGGSASQFLAYSLAKKTSRHGRQFGKGRIEGVIAADASVNATDSAALAPSLGLGIPGSPIAALLLAGLVIIGIRPGPDLLNDNMGFLWLVILILVMSNVVAVALCIGAVKPLAKLTFVPSVYLVPIIIALALFGVVEADDSFASVPIALGLGVFGYLMKLHGYSRATMIIGFVLADLLERNYLLATNIHGYGFLLLPLPLTIVAVPLALIVIATFWGKARQRNRGHQERESDYATHQR